MSIDSFSSALSSVKFNMWQLNKHKAFKQTRMYDETAKDRIGRLLDKKASPELLERIRKSAKRDSKRLFTIRVILLLFAFTTIILIAFLVTIQINR